MCCTMRMYHLGNAFERCLILASSRLVKVMKLAQASPSSRRPAACRTTWATVADIRPPLQPRAARTAVESAAMARCNRLYHSAVKIVLRQHGVPTIERRLTSTHHLEHRIDRRLGCKSRTGKTEFIWTGRSPSSISYSHPRRRQLQI
jgi:hypothetical protein